MFEDLGGTFIKFGQVLALQPDIIPMEYCNVLFNLMDRVAPFGYDDVERTIVEELGRKPDELFDCFDPIPLATASIGQVHVATLDGRKYAVKVQRPNVIREFASDVWIMKLTIHLIRSLRIRSLHWIIEPLSEFVAWTNEELDYRYEARYMQQLLSNGHGKAHVRIPETASRFTTTRTLVVEFMEGITLLDYLRAIESRDEFVLHRLRAAEFNAERFAGNIVRNFLDDAFRHGMFHADLHPANLMILPNNVVGYIDFGITAVLSTYSRRHLIGLTLAYATGDLDGMCTAFFKVSDMAPDADPGGFRKQLNTLSLGWYGEPGAGPRLKKSITLMMMDLLTLSRKTGIWPERDVIKYIRSAIALDGLIKRIAPEFDVGLELQHVCEHQIKRRLRQSVFPPGPSSTLASRVATSPPSACFGRASCWSDLRGGNCQRGSITKSTAGTVPPVRPGSFRSGFSCWWSRLAPYSRAGNRALA